MKKKNEYILMRRHHPTNTKNKNTSMNKIPDFIQKKFAPSFHRHYLSFLINGSASAGIRPDDLELAQIIPVHKSGLKVRPIGLKTFIRPFDM